MASAYPRDLVGYGPEPPHPRWPGDARLAVSFVLNYEEGAENTPLNGDAGAETFINELPTPAHAGLRNVNTESFYDYGGRAGVWRILRMFERAGLPLTVFAVGKALSDNPAVGRACVELGHEVASHHWRWIDYSTMAEDTERDHVRWSIEAIESITGKKPSGWYAGRGSLQSRRLAVEQGCFTYDSDVYDDDLPHWAHVDGEPLLLIPYALDTNDVKFTVDRGFSSGEDFLTYLRGAFDILYEEGAYAPKMMSVGLHCRVSGRPARASALRRFLGYVRGFGDVWICRRDEIAAHWYDVHPPGGQQR